MKKAAALFTLVLIAAIGAAVWINIVIVTPNKGQGEAVIEIEKGASARRVAQQLHKQGVISSPLLFELETRVSKRAGGIRAGEYSIPRNLSIRQVAAKLAEGKTILYKVTIREGLTVSEIGRELEKAGIVGADEFIAEADKYTGSSSWKAPIKSVEGYLYPETYHFRKNVPASEVVKTMIDSFYKAAGSVAPETVMSDPAALHRAVTLASIIEKETGNGEERKRISSVFTNRLKKGMLLQSDPTVIYALPNFDGNIRKKDLKYDSPYNTYVSKGLPPGPIASPGLASIDAALHPLDTKYLYFVSKNNGSHYFSTTLAEHNRAVRQYQIVGRKK